MTIAPEQIVQKVKDGGVIGAGGGGFPTHIKLQTQVTTVIANGSECEPLLASDYTMMTTHPEWLIAGLQLVMQATGATKGVIALKAHYHAAISALEKLLPPDHSITLHLLANYYPAGDEFLLVYEITGKIIPEGGLPFNIGILVNNVVTLMQIYHAVNNKPVTERMVTLTGEFKAPKIVTVPIGTTYQELVKIGGGLRDPNSVLLDGGPMMGKIVSSWEEGIAKTTSGVVALPLDHFIIRMSQEPLTQMVARSKAACCQCFRCSDLCPRNLIGHELYPHMTMRTIDYNQAEPTHHITAAFLCSQCGICELLACDFMLLSPRKIFAAYREKLSNQGIKNPHHKSVTTPNSQLANRKIALPLLLKKLDLVKYDQPLHYHHLLAPITKVRIGLTKHIGSPATPLVQLGQQVKKCAMIAATATTQLGTVYHASIAGKVSAINNEWIEITT